MPAGPPRIIAPPNDGSEGSYTTPPVFDALNVAAYSTAVAPAAFDESVTVGETTLRAAERVTDPVTAVVSADVQTETVWLPAAALVAP
jgi:hypothetical protein